MSIQHEEMGSARTREARFVARGAVSARVRLASGRLSVRTHDGVDVVVRLTSRARRPEERLEASTIEFDESTGRLEVSGPERHGGGGLGWKSLALGASSDVDADLLVPSGSSVVASSASGNADLVGRYEKVEFSTASGNLEVDSAERIKHQSASGRVRARRVSQSLDVKTASGDVDADEVIGRVKIVSVSGDVALTTVGAADVSATVVSGTVEVFVAEGLVVTVEAGSTSGELSSEIPFDGRGTDSAGEHVQVRARTVSGDVRLRRAPAVAVPASTSRTPDAPPSA